MLECLRVLQHDSHGTAFKPLCLGLLRGMRAGEGGGGDGGFSPAYLEKAYTYEYACIPNIHNEANL